MALPTPTVAPVITNGSIPQGHTSYLYLPAVANLVTGAVLAELTAGTDYKGQIASVDGFAPQGSVVDFPNASNRVIGNIPGTFSLGTGTTVFNLTKTGTGDARGVFVDGTDGVTSPSSGVWAFFYDGLVTGGKYRLFAATVTSANPSTDLAAPLTLSVMWALQAASGFLTMPTA